jgi:hypothetical protein
LLDTTDKLRPSYRAIDIVRSKARKDGKVHVPSGLDGTVNEVFERLKVIQPNNEVTFHIYRNRGSSWETEEYLMGLERTSEGWFAHRPNPDGGPEFFCPWPVHRYIESHVVGDGQI